MLEALITSQTRIKLLLKFFLNSSQKSYLRSLEHEFGESTNAIRIELNRFEKAGLLTSSLEGNKKYYQANTSHSLYQNINGLIRNHIGLNRIIERLESRLDKFESIYLVGSLVQGKDNGTIDLVFVGSHIDQSELERMIDKAEKLIKRKIVFQIVPDMQSEERILKNEALLLWQAEG